MTNNKNLLLVSSGGGKNFKLANSIKKLVDSAYPISTKIINLELYNLPLYKPGINTDNKVAKGLSQEFENSNAFIFCAPEYNGGSPPILTNAITWISITTNNWRDCFSGKIALIGTNSGGDGLRFLASFRSQLEYLGTIVVPKTISVNDKKEFNQDSAKRSLQSLIDLL
ncbi:NAD(P)H-dependent oxidoreductase [Candidatus Marinimicrobia bacterium]|nr:NAD(P)H-dependent oxidoreductase [Candidatus Neomarinimicrobiota bacterium]